MSKIAALLLGLTVALGAGAAHAQQPVKLRIGWAQAPGHMAPLLYQNKDKIGRAHV